MGRTSAEAQGGEGNCQPQSYPTTYYSGTIITLPFPRSLLLKLPQKQHTFGASMNSALDSFSTNSHGIDTNHLFRTYEFFFSVKKPSLSSSYRQSACNLPAKSYLNRPLKYISTFDEPSPTARLKASHIPGTLRLPSFSINPFSFHGIPITLFFILFFDQSTYFYRVQSILIVPWGFHV